MQNNLNKYVIVWDKYRSFRPCLITTSTWILSHENTKPRTITTLNEAIKSWGDTWNHLILPHTHPVLVRLKIQGKIKDEGWNDFNLSLIEDEVLDAK